jgi:hypothetical protein
VPTCTPVAGLYGGRSEISQGMGAFRAVAACFATNAVGQGCGWSLHLVRWSLDRYRRAQTTLWPHPHAGVGVVVPVDIRAPAVVQTSSVQSVYVSVCVWCGCSVGVFVSTIAPALAAHIVASTAMRCDKFAGALKLDGDVCRLASSTDMIGWSRVLPSHTLDAARSY